MEADREYPPDVIERHAQRIREAGERIRATAERLDGGGRFKDYNPSRRASETGTLDKFNAAVDFMTAGGIPSGMANVLAEVLHLPTVGRKQSASNAEQSTGDAGHLTDSERAALLPLIPPRSKHSTARVTDDDVMDTIDRLLTKHRLKLRSRDMADWPKLKARADQLAQRGAFEAITHALADLDLSDARKRELRSLCDSMGRRKARLGDLKAERDKAGRY